MRIEEIGKRLNELISLSDEVLATEKASSHGSSVSTVYFNTFRSACLSFLRNTFGELHPFYFEFNTKVKDTYAYHTREGKGILLAVKQEIEGGWLINFKGLVSGEIFSDFLEMAEHLIEENYKDAAAVMIGSVLEEHLRQLCITNGISIEIVKSDKNVPKKADTLNSELASSSVYNKLDQKSITSWLDLRNKAAHGKYSDYTIEQVKIMLQSVRDFISRTPL